VRASDRLKKKRGEKKGKMLQGSASSCRGQADPRDHQKKKKKRQQRRKRREMSSPTSRSRYEAGGGRKRKKEGRVPRAGPKCFRCDQAHERKKERKEHPPPRSWKGDVRLGLASSLRRQRNRERGSDRTTAFWSHMLGGKREEGGKKRMRGEGIIRAAPGLAGRREKKKEVRIAVSLPIRGAEARKRKKKEMPSLTPRLKKKEKKRDWRRAFSSSPSTRGGRGERIKKGFHHLARTF